jgi:uridine kinase
VTGGQSQRAARAGKTPATSPRRAGSARRSTARAGRGAGRDQRRVLLGIAGGSASGKTLVADRVCEELSSSKIAIIKQDSYYKDLSHLPFEERTRQNFDHPDAFDRELLYNHVRLLLEGSRVEVPVYDFKKHLRLTETVPISGCQIIILEGILLLDDPLLRTLMDIKVYIDTDPDIRLLRRIQRDVADRGRTLSAVLEQYLSSVRPMHLQFVEPSKRYADIIVPEGGHNEVAIDLLVTKIRSVLETGTRRA